MPVTSRDLSQVLRLSDVTFSYEGSPTILRDVNVKVAQRSRVAVLGGNGAGKSTLIKLLVGDLVPLAGDVWKHPNLR